MTSGPPASEYHLRDAALKVGRARHHLRELAATIERGLPERPYEIVRGSIADERPYPVSLHVADMGLGKDVALIVGDVVQNLRAALDLLVFGIGIAKGLSRTKLDKLYFPFAGDAALLEADSRRKLKLLPAKVRDMVLALQPHGEGNRSLWGLNKLSVRDKHHLLIANFALPEVARLTLSTAGGPVTVSGRDFEANPYGFLTAIVPTVTPGPVEMEKDFQAQAQMVFGDIEPFQGQEIVTTLTKLADQVDAIVADFAAVEWSREA